MDLSIIVPIYNVEKYLRECLDSLYKIEGLNYEIILVNDGSKDSSSEIAKEYKERYPEITVFIDKENGGLSSARNAGIEVARGNYLSFIDSDDFIDSIMFSEFVKKTLDSKVDVAVANLKYYFDDGKTSPPLFRSNSIREAGIVSGKKFLDLIMSKPKCFREEAVDDLYSRDFLISNNLFFKEGLLHEDTLFTTLIYLKASKVLYLDYPFYFYRQRSGGIMSTVTQKSTDSIKEICRVLTREYEKIPLKGEGKIALSKLIISLYKAVVFREYDTNPNSKEFYREYRRLFIKLKGLNNGIFNEILLFLSLKISIVIRKLMDREIKNVQKLPEIKN